MLIVSKICIVFWEEARDDVKRGGAYPVPDSVAAAAGVEHVHGNAVAASSIAPHSAESARARLFRTERGTGFRPADLWRDSSRGAAHAKKKMLSSAKVPGGKADACFEDAVAALTNVRPPAEARKWVELEGAHKGWATTKRCAGRFTPKLPPSEAKADDAQRVGG